VEHPFHLYYNKPADIWNNAIPLGNGRLGMIYGQPILNALYSMMIPFGQENADAFFDAQFLQRQTGIPDRWQPRCDRRLC